MSEDNGETRTLGRIVERITDTTQPTNRRYGKCMGTGSRRADDDFRRISRAMRLYDGLFVIRGSCGMNTGVRR